MKLVFVRHGKAEPAGMGIDDESRRLTGEGEARVRKLARFLSRNFSRQKMRIWCSPLLRAQQTAEILASKLAIKKISQHESLARGDWETIAEELARKPGNRVVFLVGHEPYLSRWLRKITGNELVMKPGTAVGVDWQADSGFGSICWVMSTATAEFFAWDGK